MIKNAQPEVIEQVLDEVDEKEAAKILDEAKPDDIKAVMAQAKPKKI